jgi:ribulose-phosphate 3-epimerase
VPIDVHLMVQPVDALAQAFAQAGAGLISFHPEASRHVDRTLALIRDRPAARPAWCSTRPRRMAWLDHVMDKLDLVMLMSVNPGFGGQSFIASTLPKLEKVRQRLDAEAARPAATSGWRWTAASSPTTSPTSPAPAPTPSWPAARSSVPRITRR